ncbi:hypothetical protein LTR86_007043 [Recurvomyces mirabilis]|nr:hypothetical protein LTR86_007043 [Recurvomyces mirabilis]
MAIDSDAADGTVDGATIIPNMLGQVSTACIQELRQYLTSSQDESQNRSSPFTAFAQHQVQERSNFIILTGHRVLNINWKDCDGMVASGVNFQASKNGDIHSVTAKREVLLAAGSLQSPQILELSGVGDPGVLAAAGVPLKIATPGVGKHMQEQTKNSLYYDAKDLIFNGSGPPSAIAFPNIHQLLKDDAATMYDTTMSNIATHAADLERKGLVVDSAATQAVLEAQVNNLFEDNAPAAEVFFTVFPNEKQIGVDLWNLIVLSRGTCHTKSDDSWVRPIVDPAYFGHPQDLAIQIAASKQSREVFRTEPLSQFVASETVPGSAVSQDNTDTEWDAWVKGSFTSVWHYIATAAMMEEDKGGVVSNRFKVYGIDNVRVVDASVLPIQLSAHLSSSLYGIALKAAKIIQEDQF